MLFFMPMSLRETVFAHFYPWMHPSPGMPASAQHFKWSLLHKALAVQQRSNGENGPAGHACQPEPSGFGRAQASWCGFGHHNGPVSAL